MWNRYHKKGGIHLKKLKIFVIVKALNSEFWQALLSGAKKAGDDFSDAVMVSTHGPKEETDVEEQAEILNHLLSENPDAIVIASTSNDLTVPAIEKAMDSGIPVITIDNRINTDKISAFIATDNRKAAAFSADKMAILLKQAGDVKKSVVVLNSLADSKVDQDRDEGFLNRIQDLVCDINVLDTIHVENNLSLAEEKITELIAATEGMISVFADNDQTGIGLARAVRKMHAQDRVYAFAFDSAEEEISAVKDGDLKGIVVQNPFKMGYEGVKMAMEAVQGRQIERNVDTGAVIVTKENMNESSVQELLYPNC